MRSPIIALLASAAVVFTIGCAQENLDEIVARIECADSSVTKCLRSADIRKLDEIEACLVAGGCSLACGPSEAVWFTDVCRAGQEDLKKKRADILSDSTAELTTTAVSAASAEAITTSDPASSSQSTSSSSTASSTTGISTSFSSLSMSSVSASATGACSVTKTYSVSACSISNGKILTCIPATSLGVSCAPGKICFSGTPDVCLTRKDSLDTAGTIVTIVFSIVLSAIAIAVIVMVIREYQREKQYRAAKLFAAAASKSQGEEARTTRKPITNHADLSLTTPAEDRSDDHSVHQE